MKTKRQLKAREKLKPTIQQAALIKQMIDGSRVRMESTRVALSKLFDGEKPYKATRYEKHKSNKWTQ